MSPSTLARLFLAAALTLPLLLTGCAGMVETEPPAPRAEKDYRIPTEPIPSIVPGPEAAADPDILLRRGRYTEALEAYAREDDALEPDSKAFREVTRLSDALATAYRHLNTAMDQLEKGRKDKARASLDKALLVYPGLPAARDISLALAETNPPAGGRAAAKKGSGGKEGKGATPTPEDRNTARMYRETGRRYFEQGDLPAAVGAWERSLELEPGDAGTRTELVELLTNLGLRDYGQGQLDEAIGWWERARKLDPDNKELSGFLDKARLEVNKAKEIKS